MKYIPAFFIAFLFIACQPQSTNENQIIPDLSEAPPESVGMSSTRLERIDNVLNEYVDNHWIPGAVAVVTRKGKVVYKKSFGYKNVEQNQPMKTDDIFRIASQTKAITTVALMMLYEEGKFLLDDPVHQYIPEFEDPTVLVEIDLEIGKYETEPAKSQITIRQLLTHTSGIGYGFIHPKMNFFYEPAGIPDGFVVSDATLGDKIILLAKQPLLFEPGSDWAYGLNTDVAGYLVEVLSEMTLQEYFSEKIFKPLGMDDSHFYLPEDKLDRLVTIYESTEDGIKPSEEDSYNYPFEGGMSYFSGGAGISATAMDYTRFMQMLLNGGELNGKRLLGRKTIDLITTNQIGDLRIWGGAEFGLGFALVTDEQKHLTLNSVGNYAWGGYFSTTYWMDPEEELSATLMTQMAPTTHGEVHDKFHVLVYQAIID